MERISSLERVRMEGSIYSLLLGKKSHLFTMNKKIVGEYIKQYDDRETWTDEEFGLPVNVMLETFSTPITEMVSSWKKIVEIMGEEGWELQESKLFTELYAEQTGVSLTQEQQTFSFLNRAFVFKKGKKRAPVMKVVDAVVEEVLTEEESQRSASYERIPNLSLCSLMVQMQARVRSATSAMTHSIQLKYGEQYPTVEHYFQAMKAKEFNDEEVYKKIVSLKDSQSCKGCRKERQETL
jgi:hypothetical protein